jgi:hypothetical protein
MDDSFSLKWGQSLHRNMQQRVIRDIGQFLGQVGAVLTRRRS